MKRLKLLRTVPLAGLLAVIFVPVFFVVVRRLFKLKLSADMKQAQSAVPQEGR